MLHPYSQGTKPPANPDLFINGCLTLAREASLRCLRLEMDVCGSSWAALSSFEAQVRESSWVRLLERHGAESGVR
jgi:hypothetical protein